MRSWLGGLVAVVAVGLGLSQLRLEADIFGLLPADLPVVQALARYQQAFGGSRELLVSVQADDARTAEESAGAIAGALDRAALSPRVVWRNPMRDDPAARAELVAWLWFNAEPESFRRFVDGFDDAPLASRLADTLDRISLSLRPTEIGRLMMDPYGFTELPQSAGMGSLAGTDPLSAADGRFRLLFVAPPPSLDPGFAAVDAWVDAVRAAATTAAGDATVAVSGTPALNAELGTGLVDDMQLAALTTLLLVAALFWLVHRGWRPLAWLLTLLVFVLAATIAAGTLLFGTLNVISLGFAAILLGLAAGYGLLLYQEYVSDPSRDARWHRRAVGPSIVWASATTAGAFLMVGRSSLPGMTQLGVLVAVGIAVAAAVMVAIYLQPLVRRGGEPPRDRWPAALLPALRPRTAWLVTAAALFASLTVLAVRPPAVDPSTRSLGPKASTARTAMDDIEDRIGGQNSGLWLIAQAPDDAGMVDKLRAADAVLAAALETGTLAAQTLPTSLWPRPGNQLANAETAQRLIARWPAARALGEDTGFTGDSLALAADVVGALDRFQDMPGAAAPAHPSLQWLFSQFRAQQDDQVLAAGRLKPGDDVDGTALETLAQELATIDGVSLAGWQLASRSLLDTMRSDLRQVLLPMIAVLILVLGLAYRRPGEVVLSAVTLGFSFVYLLAVMGLAGWSWNLMNVMALPLLLGVAVDYSIHVQLALQRHHGSVAEMHQTVGRAIVLAGATTTIGFGSLGLASNAGLASLGLVCATGVALACAVSVLLLPLWWRALRRRGMDSASRG